MTNGALSRDLVNQIWCYSFYANLNHTLAIMCRNKTPLISKYLSCCYNTIAGTQLAYDWHDNVKKVRWFIILKTNTCLLNSYIPATSFIALFVLLPCPEVIHSPN